MKKFLSLILSIGLITCMFSTSAFAVIEKDTSIVSLQNLIERSGNEVTFMKTEKLPQTRSSSSINNYKMDMTKLTFCSVEEAIQFENILRSAGTNTEETMDDSLLVTLTTTIYYSVSPSNVDDRELIKLTKVTGSYTSPYAAGNYMGNGVYCTDSSVRLGQIGFNINGGTITDQVYNKNMGTQRSWSVTPPSSWKPIVRGDQEAVGCRYTITLSRGSTEWYTELSNNA